MKNFTRIIIALISFTLFANFFFFRTSTPLSTGLFFLGLGIFYFAIAEYRHKSMWMLALTGIYTIGILWMRAAHFIQTESIIGIMIIAASLWYVSISESNSFGSLTAVFFSPFFSGLTYLKRVFLLIKPTTIALGYRKVTSLFGDQKKHSNNISTLIGFTIAIPITLILLVMFAAADPIYLSYLKNIISPDFIQELPWRIVLSSLVFGATIPFVFPKIRRIFLSPGAILGRLRMTHELTIIMSIVALVIASFIIIQWPYVFANVKAENDLSRFGVATYAEYVKRGFIELLRVSAFIYAMLWLGLTALRNGEINKTKILSILQWIVIGEFFVILISIARRVYLYQMYHGLTLIRVYGFFFLIWLVCMTITLAGRHLRNKLRFGYIEGIITLVIFMVLGVLNVEQYIVRNHPPTVNKRIDYIYLSRMSADGVEGWVKAYNHAKEIIGKYTNTSGEIDKNGRREIAYAEYIIYRMTYYQYDYMSKFASPIEMKNYVREIVSFQNERLDREKSELERYLITRGNETWIRERISEIEQIKKSIEKLKKQSLTEVAISENGEVLLSDVSIDEWQSLQSFDPPSTPALLSFYRSTPNMMMGTVVDRYTKTTSLDRLYSQNISEMSAFQIIKDTIPLAELHELQIHYFDLYTRIGKQGARDYETDISLESPLL